VENSPPDELIMATRKRITFKKPNVALMIKEQSQSIKNL
jgi:hypothetical protein